MGEENLREAQQQDVRRSQGENHTSNYSVRTVTCFGGSEFSVRVSAEAKCFFIASFTFRRSDGFLQDGS